MDKKYLIFEMQPEQGRLENIAEQLEQNTLVNKIRQQDCGIIVTYAGSYSQLLEQLGQLPENICVEPLGTAKEN